MTNQSKHIAIVGGGLVGSLLSIYLAKRGYRVSVFERRDDNRNANSPGGRSINLALSTRGIRALEETGLSDQIKKIAIPMHGRLMHDTAGHLTFQPYGKQGQFINSISRSELTTLLVNSAEKLNVKFFFNHKCTQVNFYETSLTCYRGSDNEYIRNDFDLIIGADGAFSAVRSGMQVRDRFNYSQEYLEHGYKELHIPADNSGNFVLEKNALHIWPRESFMMIALPNPDGSFTCTLFLPFEGNRSFSTLSGDQQIRTFFGETFPDVLGLMPDLRENFKSNPTASLVTIRCFPWAVNKTLLIGDAAHGIVPFYGQGMNAGFEDCRILNDMLNAYEDDWTRVLPAFQSVRKPDTDAIARLAIDNFIEMRDWVADEGFLLRKKIEARLHELFPDKWIPQYSMVTFHDNIPYSEAYLAGQRQKKIMDAVMAKPGIRDHWETLNFQEIADAMH